MADIIQNLGNLSDEALKLLGKTPVAVPPTGVQPNLVDPPTRAALQTWTTSVFLAIALVMYANRLYVKAKLMKTWSWDDGMSSQETQLTAWRNIPLTYSSLTIFSDVGNYCCMLHKPGSMARQVTDSNRC